MTRVKQIILCTIFIIIITLSLIYYYYYYYLTWSNTNKAICVTLSSISKSNNMNSIERKHENMILTHTSSYTLDSECKFDKNDSFTEVRRQEFDIIFETGRWDSIQSRSGPGSSLEGAYDWIRHLRALFRQFSIRSIADIPCGDTYWQFSLREINTIEELYFGGDISMNVIKQNQRLYGSSHKNKLFQYWDLVNCPIPAYTYKNSTHEIKLNRFDLVLVRDAIQHMNIKNGLKAVRNVIMSGAKFFALSSYPANGRSSATNTRSLENNQPFQSITSDCGKKDYCLIGNIKEGDAYPNNINCPPFNFPLNKAILVQPSHSKFPMEYDEMHIYKIDDELIKIVQQYDKAC